MSRGTTSIKFNITAVFAVLAAMIIGTVVYSAYRMNSKSLLELADDSIAGVSEAMFHKTNDMLSPLAATVKHLAILAKDHEQIARSEKIFPTFISILDSFPQLQSVYYAFERDGRFLQAFVVPPGIRRYGPNRTAMHPDVHYALRVLDHGGTKPVDHWKYLNKKGDLLFEEDAIAVTYDARKRDWYKAVTKNPGKSFWTDVVVFTSSRLPGIAPAFPIVADGGRVIGAAAANVTLDSLSLFLGGLKVGKTGIALIMDKQNRLVAHPDAGRAVKQSGNDITRVKAHELEEAWVAEAVKRHDQNKRSKFIFESAGKDYIASFVDFPPDFQKPWVMAVIVPVDDFVGSLKANNRNILMIAVLVTALSMGFIAVFSGWISRPILMLVDEIKKIRNLDLSGDIDIKSNTFEIMELSDSLRTMKTALTAFGRFVPKGLVHDLIQSGKPIELGGQSRQLTIMFTDLEGFSSLSERIPTRELMLHISEHFDLVIRTVHENRGTIDKFIGDSVMAFWGAPARNDEHTHDACRSALQVKARMDELNVLWEKEGRPQLRTRIGIHTDSVLVGNIGSMDRMSYTVIGDGVNVASRLEGVNKVYGTQICASHSVFKEAGESFLFRPMDMVSVVGRHAGLIVYEIVAANGGEDPAIEGTPEQKELCKKSLKAFYAYLEQRWDDAIAGYEDIQAMIPGDLIAGIFLERCRLYQSSPPPDDWTGIHTLESK